MIYFPTNLRAKEPQNLPNHRVVIVWLEVGRLVSFWDGFLAGAFAVCFGGVYVGGRQI